MQTPTRPINRPAVKVNIGTTRIRMNIQSNAECSLFAQSGHRQAGAKCLLLTRSGHEIDRIRNNILGVPKSAFAYWLPE